jgi:WD40 repeat protein
MAFLPDGTLLVAVEDAVRHVDAATGREVGPRLAAGMSPRWVSVSADGRRAVVVPQFGGSPPTMWDVDGGRLERTLSDQWTLARLRPDGDSVAIVSPSSDNVVVLVDAETGEIRHQLRGQTSFIEDLYYSPDGTLLITAGSDFVAEVWSTKTGQLIDTLSGHAGIVREGRATAGGETAVTVSLDGLAIAWDLTGRRGMGVRLPGFAAPDGLAPIGPADLPSAELSSDGSRLIAGTPAGHVVVVSLEDGRLLVDDGTAHPGGVQDTGVASDGELAATAGGDGTVRLWDLASGKPLGAPVRHEEPVRSVALDRNAGRLAYGDAAGHVRIVSLAAPAFDVIRDVDLGPPEPLGPDMPDLAGEPSVLEFSPDASAVAVGLSSRGVVLVEIETGDVRRLVPGDVDPGSAEFSPDGTVLTVGDNNDGSLLRFRVSDGRPVGERQTAANGFVLTITHTADGRMATSGSEGTVRLWDPATGQALGPPLPVKAESAFVGFTPNALRVVHGDGTVTDWPTDISAWRTRACTVAGRSLTRDEWAQYLPDRTYAPACIDGRYVG